MTADCQYSHPGPCVPSSTMQTALKVGSPTSPLRLDLRVTIPHAADGELTPPFPTIIFFNGFQVLPSTIAPCCCCSAHAHHA